MTIEHDLTWRWRMNALKGWITILAAALLLATAPFPATANEAGKQSLLKHLFLKGMIRAAKKPLDSFGVGSVPFPGGQCIGAGYFLHLHFRRPGLEQRRTGRQKRNQKTPNPFGHQLQPGQSPQMAEVKGKMPPARPLYGCRST